MPTNMPTKFSTSGAPGSDVPGDARRLSQAISTKHMQQGPVQVGMGRQLTSSDTKKKMEPVRNPDELINE